MTRLDEAGPSSKELIQPVRGRGCRRKQKEVVFDPRYKVAQEMIRLVKLTGMEINTVPLWQNDLSVLDVPLGNRVKAISLFINENIKVAVGLAENHVAFLTLADLCPFADGDVMNCPDV